MQDLKRIIRVASATGVAVAIVLAMVTASGATGPPRCLGKEATVFEVEGLRVNGTPKPDVIVTAGGKQEIKSRGGADRICAGPGSDFVDSGSGADRIRGGPGLDLILAQSGRDLVFGEDGNDLLGGNGGRDRLFGNRGRDRLDGRGGRDVCSGGPGRDTASACERVRGADEPELRSPYSLGRATSAR